MHLARMAQGSKLEAKTRENVIYLFHKNGDSDNVAVVLFFIVFWGARGSEFCTFLVLEAFISDGLLTLL